MPPSAGVTPPASPAGTPQGQSVATVKPAPRSQLPLVASQTALLTSRSLGPDVVVLRPGRTRSDEISAVDDDGLLECVASGYGRRMIRNLDGSLRSVGIVGLIALPDIVMQDLPANYQRRADCLITVDRRPSK